MSSTMETMPAPAQNAPAKTDKIGAFAQRFASSVGTALPKHMTTERFIRALTTCMRRTPKLAECDFNTLGAAVTTAAQLGLTPDLNGSCYLLPFQNKGKMECQLIVGYQGLIDLCFRSGLIKSIRADVVCEGDEFDYEDGINPKLRHKRDLHSKRGEPYAVYAVAETKDGGLEYVVLDKYEIAEVKNASRGGNSSYSPWNGPFQTEMWKKTAIRRLCKLLPKSTDLLSALDFENHEDGEYNKNRAREVEVSVAPDPLAAGRHTRRAKTEPQKTEQPAEDPEQEELKQLIAYCEKAAEMFPEAAEIWHGSVIDQNDINVMRQVKTAIAAVTSER